MQTKWQSMVEAFFNTLSGYLLSVLVQVFVFPWFGVHLPLHTNMVIVAIFTAVSIVRSYFWRRFFNRRHAKADAAKKACEELAAAMKFDLDMNHRPVCKEYKARRMLYTPQAPCNPNIVCPRCNGNQYILGEYPGTTSPCPACNQ